VRGVGIGLFLCSILIVAAPVSAQSDCQSAELKSCDCPVFAEQTLEKARQLVTENRLTEAADGLEGVLMRCPEQAAVYDYYIGLLPLLDSSEAPPSDYYHTLTEPGWTIIKRLGVQGGYSDNLNRAPAQSTITLDLFNAPLTLDLLPEFKVQGGVSSLVNVGVNAYRRVSGTEQWQFAGDFVNRASGNEGYADYQRGRLFGEWRRGIGEPLEYSAEFAFDVLRYANDQYLAVAEIQLQQRWQANHRCQLLAGQDFLWQRQLDLAVMDSYYAGINAGLTCSVNDAQYQLKLSTGGDWGDALRPGGTRWRNQARVSALWTVDVLWEGSMMRVVAQYAQVNDAHEYSALLGEGQARQVQQVLLKSSYQWPIARHEGSLISGQIDLSWQEEDSNIALFGVDYVEVWGGVNVKW